MKNSFNLRKNKYLPSDSDLKKLQSLLGHVLPSDYLSFMREYNDFMPKPLKAYCFKIDWSNKSGAAPFSEASIASWEGLEALDKKGLLNSISHLWMKNEELIPSDVMPIASDGGGGMVLMGISKKNCGKVYYWFDGAPFEPGEPTYDNIGFVANSFTEFLESLYPCEE